MSVAIANVFSAAIYNLNVFPEKDAHEDYRIFYAGVVVGAGNILQWSLLAAAPFIQVTTAALSTKKKPFAGLNFKRRRLYVLVITQA